MHTHTHDCHEISNILVGKKLAPACVVRGLALVMVAKPSAMLVGFKALCIWRKGGWVTYTCASRLKVVPPSLLTTCTRVQTYHHDSLIPLIRAKVVVVVLLVGKVLLEGKVLAANGRQVLHL